ncbi:MAG: hypothetical protein JXA17_06585 [Dehalococcoidales bacterium]|nr:hypothetical protein [Dehalococcoidales bacterium]
MKQSGAKKICLKSLPVLLALVVFCLYVAYGAVMADTTWTQTTQADFTSGSLDQLDATSSPGDVKLAQWGSGYIYAFKGSETKTFWRYDIATDTWSALADAPCNVAAGGALACDGNNYIYALHGNLSGDWHQDRYFSRYDIASNTWTSLANTPSSVGEGGSLTFDGTYIYALRGNYRQHFWRYDIATNSWSYLAYTPAGVGGGGALTYAGGDYIYALRGSSTNNFWKYSISGDTWTSLTGTPSGVDEGGALAADGDNYVYALKGLNTVTFWRYNISTDSWLAMPDTPATPCVYGGGALVFDKNTNFYALHGNNEDDFWEYSVAGNSWATMHDTPACVGYGGALAFKEGGVYYSSGSLISSTYDTGNASVFGNLTWTSTTPGSTSLRFQIATNNDSSTWLFKGPDGDTGTYYFSSGTPVWDGHYTDRYIKYKAFFDTTDTSKTPVLHDVSINYSPWTGQPVAQTAAATLVEETTATLHGSVINDGGEACQYQFIYGTVNGGPYPYGTGWTGSVTTGQPFSTAVAGLAKGTKYYFVAQVKNTSGTGSGSQLDFLTKPDPPYPFAATAVSDTQIDLSWTKGEGAQKTMIRRGTSGYPVDKNDGVQVYFDTATSYSDTGLVPDTLYYYRAWSYVTGSEQWSDGYADASAQTTPGPTTTPPTTSPTTEVPLTIGGSVYPVNKLDVLMPWLCLAVGFMSIVGGVIFKVVRRKSSRRNLT